MDDSQFQIDENLVKEYASSIFNKKEKKDRKDKDADNSDDEFLRSAFFIQNMQR